MCLFLLLFCFGWSTDAVLMVTSESAGPMASAVDDCAGDEKKVRFALLLEWELRSLPLLF